MMQDPNSGKDWYVAAVSAVDPAMLECYDG